MDSYTGSSKRDRGSRYERDYKTSSSSSRRRDDIDMKDIERRLESLSINAENDTRAGKEACEDGDFAEAIKLYEYALEAYKRKLEISLEMDDRERILQSRRRDVAEAAALLEEAEADHYHHTEKQRIRNLKDLELNYKKWHRKAAKREKEALSHGESSTATEAWRKARDAYLEAEEALMELKHFDAGFVKSEYPDEARELHDAIVDAFVQELQRHHKYLVEVVARPVTQRKTPDVFRAYELAKETLDELGRFDPHFAARDPSGQLRELRDKIDNLKQPAAWMKAGWTMAEHVAAADRAITKGDQHRAATAFRLASEELENSYDLMPASDRKSWTEHCNFRDKVIGGLEAKGAAKFGRGWASKTQYARSQHSGPQYSETQYAEPEYAESQYTRAYR